MSDQPDSDDKPMTLKDRIFSALWALGFLALGGAMIFRPDAVSGASDRPRKLIGKIVVWIWGWPAGLALVVFGLLIAWSVFSKSETKKGDETTPTPPSE